MHHLPFFGPGDIVRLRNHPDGIEVVYRRPDGSCGRWVTGARRRAGQCRG